jgi:hypothetical protein
MLLAHLTAYDFPSLLVAFAAGLTLGAAMAYGVVSLRRR